MFDYIIEQLLNIQQAARSPVEVVLGSSVSMQPAADGDLGDRCCPDDAGLVRWRRQRARGPR